MSIENKNLDDYWSSRIDGANNGFPVTGNDARFYEREELAKARELERAFVIPDLQAPIANSEKSGPRHRADTPLKGVVGIANRKF